MSRAGKSIETESKLVLGRDWGQGYGEWQLVAMGFPFGVMKMS